jgi:hypothetical protein
VFPGRGAPVQKDGEEVIPVQMLYVLHESSEDLLHGITFR